MVKVGRALGREIVRVGRMLARSSCELSRLQSESARRAHLHNDTAGYAPLRMGYPALIRLKLGALVWLPLSGHSFC